MSQLIACYQRYLNLPDDAPENLPAEVYFFSNPNGKVRMHKRGQHYRIDKWLASFNDAADVINAIVNTGYYKLRTPGYKPDPFQNALFKKAIISQPKMLAVAP